MWPLTTKHEPVVVVVIILLLLLLLVVVVVLRSIKYRTMPSHAL